MSEFSKKSIWYQSNEDVQDPGVKVADLIKLVEDNDIDVQLLNLMEVDAIKDEYIEIPNAGSLVAIQKALNQKYHKEDLIASSNDISLFAPNDDFSINFHDIKGNEYFQSLGQSKISTTPIYSARTSFLRNYIKWIDTPHNCLIRAFGILLK